MTASIVRRNSESKKELWQITFTACPEHQDASVAPDFLDDHRLRLLHSCEDCRVRTHAFALGYATGKSKTIRRAAAPQFSWWYERWYGQNEGRLDLKHLIPKELIKRWSEAWVQRLALWTDSVNHFMPDDVVWRGGRWVNVQADSDEKLETYLRRRSV